MTKPILSCFILLFSCYLFATENPDEYYYKNCEAFNFDEHYVEMTDIDLYFDKTYFYALVNHRQDANFNKKLQCLIQKRKNFIHHAHQLLQKGDCNDLCINHLLDRKDSQALSYLITIFKKERLSKGATKEYAINYLLYYETVYVYDKDGYVNLRQQPSTTSEIIQRLNNGTKINLLNYQDQWWHISLDNGQKGYIYDDRISDKLKE